ncbi:dynein light chain cytoplasmic [Lichtheimia corymbifera JMRC:FSU:9682]|uniref:Dynein light chain cytoplasmic n=1 Tax=Lichtheimia corymbifera JMRC:FSU:9682 TaxID=1263082 RepID=A0A068S6L2_9FUNG|nr:dynein light chain cytoplasmic [Lichtheimia corymbifera JMRC:FSU:9682]
MFSNTNSLPIAVITSLAVSEAGKVLYWDADDTQEAVAARGISYTLFYAIFGNLLRWSYGYRLLQIPIKDEEEEEFDYGTMTSDYGTSSGSGSIMSSSRPHSPILFSGRSSKCGVNASRSTSVNETSGLLSSFPALPSDAADDQLPQDDQLSMKTHVKRKMATWARSIHQFMTPPLYAAFLAIAVGLIPPLKKLMYDTFVHASVTLAIQSCGKAAVPIILVCLGAQLTDILEKQMQQQETHYNRKAVATAISIRMVLAPLVVIPIVLAFVRYGSAYAGVAADPVFSVMMIIVGCTPTAINLVQISQVTGAFEDEMLHLLFWSYGVVCVPVFTLVVFAALNIVDTFL